MPPQYRYPAVSIGLCSKEISEQKAQSKLRANFGSLYDEQKRARTTKNAITGAGVGLLGGLLVGAVIGAKCCSIGGVGGAVVGGLVGGFLGGLAGWWWS